MEQSEPQLAYVQPEFLVLYVPETAPHLNLFKWFYYESQIQEFAQRHQNEIKQVIHIQKSY